jgi:Flp pilus assembly protein TadD
MNDDNISFLGVKKSFLTFFLSQHNSLKELSGKTTADVCEIIKDLTRANACSLCELLSKENNNNYLNCPVIAKANVFVSHAWSSLFLEVIDALLDYESHDNVEPVFWFDIFSSNQHKQTSQDFHWWSTTFRAAIKEVGHTIMVITPWNNPVTLTRAWCIWEIFCTIDTETKFEILMNKNQMKNLDDDLRMNECGCSGIIKLFQSNVNSKSSMANNLEDQKNIHAAIEHTVGFSSLDRLVFNTMEKHIILTLQKKLESYESESRLYASHLHDSLAIYYQEKGQIDLAEEHFSKSLVLKTATLSPNDIKLWLGKANLASILVNRGRYDEAQTKLEEYLAVMKRLAGSKWLKQSVMNSLAMVYKLNGNLLQAEQLFTELLQLQKLSGRFYADSLYATMGNLAQVYQEEGKLTESMQLTEELVESRKKTHGANHPDSMYDKSNLALIYQQLHRYDRAESLFLSCLTELQYFNGSTHPESILMAKNLAMNYAFQGRLDLAEKGLQQCLKQEKELFDDQYPGVYVTIDHLAKVLIEQRKYEDAEILLRNAISHLLARMGQDYPGLVDLKMVLSKLYRAQGKYSLALSYIEQCYEIRKSALGTNNQETLECLEKIAAVQAEMGNFDLSEANYKKCLKKRTELHGEKNSNTLNTLKELADLYFDQQMLELAEPLFDKYVRLSKELYRFENGQIFEVMFSLMEIYTKLERFQEAEATLKQMILATNRMEEGSEKQEKLAGLEVSLAATYLKQGKPELAEPVYARLLAESDESERNSSYFVLYQSLLICYLEQELYERAKHSVIEFIKALKGKEGTLEHAENMNFVGLVYYKLCEDITAESIFREGLATVNKFLQEGTNESQYAKARTVEFSIVTNLVQLYSAQGRYDLAVLTEATLIDNFEIIGRIPNETVQLYKKRYEQLKVLKGNFHPGTIGSMVNLGRVLSLNEVNHVEAECLFSESIKCGKLIFGEDHFRCYYSKMPLGKLYLEQGKDEEALALINDFLIHHLREQQQGAENKAFDLSVMWLTEVFSRQSKYHLAEKVTTCCLQTIKLILGVNHPLTMKLTFRLFQLLDAQGKYDLAEPLLHEALRISKQMKEER